METRLAEQKVRWDLLQWGQHQAPPIQARCMAIAFDLTCLASNPDNLTLRRDTMKRIVRLKEAVRTENAESASGNWTQNDTQPDSNMRPNTGRREWDQLHPRYWPSHLAFCSSSIGIQLWRTVASPR